MNTKKSDKVFRLLFMLAFLLSLASMPNRIATAQDYPPGMISYWKFDEGSGGIAGDSIGGNSGIIYGATWATGQVGGALSFDGVDDYINIGNVESLNFERTATFSIEAWIRTSKGDTNIISKFTPDARGWNFQVSGDNSIPYPSLTLSNTWYNNAMDSRSLTPFSGTDFDHVVATYDGSSSAEGISLYINGELTEKVSPRDWLTDSIRTEHDVNIGSRYPGFMHFQGEMDELAVYDRVLSTEEIQQHYQNGLIGLGYEASPPVNQPGVALDFDGTNDHIRFNEIPQISNVPALTIEVWVKPDVIRDGFLFADQGTNDNDIRIDMLADGSLRATLNKDGVGRYGTTVPEQLTAGVWTHVTMVFDGSGTTNSDRLKVYVNGSSVPLTFTGTILSLSPSAAVGGDLPSLASLRGRSGFFDGRMDEFKIWDVARSATEIMSYKDTELIGTETNLVAYYKFNQGIDCGDNAGVTTLNDDSGNSHDGTLNNFALTGCTSNWVGEGGLPTDQPPTADAGGPYTINEGGTVTLDASNSSDLDDNIVLYEWDLDNDGEYDDATGVTTDVSFADDGVFTVGLKVTDEYGEFDTDTAEITVLNVAPSIETLTAPVNPIQVGTAVETSATFTDPGRLDAHTATWAWGDGYSAGLVDGYDVSGSHVYDTPGVYTLTLTVEDDDGGVDAVTFQYVVIYDPEGGFVTGGGWIWSPEGAYTSDPSLTGKATFGFVSKYKKGATVPTGNTEFQFHVADLNFKSTSYDWLVVNQGDANAQFKGEGTINGAGTYKFMIWAGDGSPDTFRIKIWEEDEYGIESVAYDNGTDLAIEGGSIVIHKAK